MLGRFKTAVKVQHGLPFTDAASNLLKPCFSPAHELLKNIFSLPQFGVRGQSTDNECEHHFFWRQWLSVDKKGMTLE